MKLDELSVVLTGASGGIGTATAAALVAGGARVLLVSRAHEPLARLATHLSQRADAGRVEALAVDITASAGRADIVELAAVRGVNALVNNAGRASFGSFADADDARIADVIATNLTAPIQLARALLPHLVAQPAARILNVGSALGGLGVPGFSIYCGSKFGLRGFTEALRRELEGTGIRVQYLAPRTTQTAFNDERVDAFNRATGTRSDTADKVAATIVHMLSSGSPRRALGWTERIAARVNGAAPGLVDRGFGRHRAALRTTAPAIHPFSRRNDK